MLIRVSDSQRGQLLASWFIKKSGEGFTVTSQVGKDVQKAEGDASYCSSQLIQAYVWYLGRRLRGYDQQLRELPVKEFKRPGFRDGWLERQRQEIGRRRQEFEKQHRQLFYDLLKRLRNAGIPVSRLPPLPWHTSQWATQLEQAVDHRLLPKNGSVSDGGGQEVQGSLRLVKAGVEIRVPSPP